MNKKCKVIIFLATIELQRVAEDPIPLVSEKNNFEVLKFESKHWMKTPSQVKIPT
jgi:hypothetical protein